MAVYFELKIKYFAVGIKTWLIVGKKPRQIVRVIERQKHMSTLLLKSFFHAPAYILVNVRKEAAPGFGSCLKIWFLTTQH
jgi:hypothetical protein